MSTYPILVAGQWRNTQSEGAFQAKNPRTGESLPGDYPISSWQDIDTALDAAQEAFEELRTVPGERIASFLREYAGRIEAASEEICALASLETALPVEPRLALGELPRTTGQLRQAANAAAQGHWTQPVVDTAANIRTHYAGLGPVAVFGPNNFPLAFGSVSGGDFAAAIAAGNPVIAKAHPLHPGVSRLLAEAALQALDDCGLPPATVQMIYDCKHSDGERLVGDPRLGAVAFTGSRTGGLKLKTIADQAGKPISLELGSINPVVIQPGALAERGSALAEEFVGSCLMGTGQFCTNPGLVILEKGESAQTFLAAVTRLFGERPAGLLFSRAGVDSLSGSIAHLVESGAKCLVGGEPVPGEAFAYKNTLLQVSGKDFLRQPLDFQMEAFGNATLFVESDSLEQTEKILRTMEGNLTGCIYSAQDGSDDAQYEPLASILRQKVGRLLNDQMPTGVAVSPAMNHGGPYPATGHPGFTAVGVPASMLRFAMLQCYDNVRPERLPAGLRDENPLGTWRQVDGAWTQNSIPSKA